MATTASDLVRAAMKAAGIPEDRPTELARKLGLSAYDSPKRVKRWLDGENSPRYDETIALLELAGWLNTTGGNRKAAPALADPLAVLAGAVAEMAPTVRAIADALGVPQAEGGPREAAPSQQSGAPTRRRKPA